MLLFRWFEKTSVRDGLVYGLLNRRCLFVWNAETTVCLSRTELTDAVPGDAEPALNFTFLSVGDGLVATIHKNLAAVTLLTPTGKEEVAVVEVSAATSQQQQQHPFAAGAGLKVGWAPLLIAIHTTILISLRLRTFAGGRHCADSPLLAGPLRQPGTARLPTERVSPDRVGDERGRRGCLIERQEKEVGRRAGLRRTGASGRLRQIRAGGHAVKGAQLHQGRTQGH